ncbi:MAG TPA: hypothetical protein VGS08_04275 [Candidatus Saccharimonadales bacterium]|nr:hypothetical protein [Candidatus Saccharimonadales bacterium]
MPEGEHSREFVSLTAPLDAELENLRAIELETAFVAESRPIPEGLIPQGIPLGHIAFMGDFDQTPQSQDKPNNPS